MKRCFPVGVRFVTNLVKVGSISKIGLSYSEDVVEDSLQYTVFRGSEQRID